LPGNKSPKPSGAEAAAKALLSAQEKLEQLIFTTVTAKHCSPFELEDCEKAVELLKMEIVSFDESTVSPETRGGLKSAWDRIQICVESVAVAKDKMMKEARKYETTLASLQAFDRDIARVDWTDDNKIMNAERDVVVWSYRSRQALGYFKEHIDEILTRHGPMIMRWRTLSGQFSGLHNLVDMALSTKEGFSKAIDQEGWLLDWVSEQIVDQSKLTPRELVIVCFSMETSRIALQILQELACVSEDPEDTANDKTLRDYMESHERLTNVVDALAKKILNVVLYDE